MLRREERGGVMAMSERVRTREERDGVMAMSESVKF
jgi:hypothetical protein